MGQDASIGRETLPIPYRPPAGSVTYDAKDPATSFPPIEPLRPPAGAPNVLVVLIDDTGFGAASAFGGPVSTPTAERLAARGLEVRPVPHHRVVLPDRAALLSGRNHHAVGMGSITELATSAPGYSSQRPNERRSVSGSFRRGSLCAAQALGRIGHKCRPLIRNLIQNDFLLSCFQYPDTPIEASTAI
jgi:hypothetical protein